ncbi:Hypothetical predicted protein [Xyrichtys novacula]|uniref:Uncharacterized protein n=1 Tax=Xyrichtys novacula TaxID=13765 RepID=A0AAV1H761_XYRNO|nr:Hypothetical predicted protein [Xyrichtys novacula]
MDKWLKRINCTSRESSTATTSQPTCEEANASNNNPGYSSTLPSNFDLDAGSSADVASEAVSIATDSGVGCRVSLCKKAYSASLRQEDDLVKKAQI